MFEQLELSIVRGKKTHIHSNVVLRSDSRRTERFPKIMKPKETSDLVEELAIDDFGSTAHVSKRTTKMVDEPLLKEVCREIKEIGSPWKALLPLTAAADGDEPLGFVSSPPCISSTKCPHQDENLLTQVPIPLHDQLAPHQIESPDGTQNKTARYSMFCNDTTSPEHALSRFINTTLSLSPEPLLVEKGGDEPMEYFLLDYLDSLPEGFTNKLRESLNVHEELVRQLCKRNKQLQSKAREREVVVDAHVQTMENLVARKDSQNLQASSTGAKPRSAPMGETPACTTKFMTNNTVVNREVVGHGRSIESLPREKRVESNVDMDVRYAAAEVWRIHLRARMSNRIAVAHEESLPLGAEAYEATMRSRLEQTCKAARERIAAMTRRAEREEEECLVRASTAQHERERMQRDLEAVQREQIKTKAQIVELEAAIRAANAKCKEKEKARTACAREVEANRNELKVHRARATKSQQVEQRVRDMEHELQATLAAIAHTTDAANP